MASAASGVSLFQEATQVKNFGDAFHVVLGPYAAATIVSGTGTLLPFCSDKDLIIDGISLICSVDSDGSSTMVLFRGSLAADTNVAGIITAAQDVTAAVNLETGLVADTPANLTIQRDNNLLLAGESLVALATGATTGLVGLYFNIRGRYRLPN